MDAIQALATVQSVTSSPSIAQNKEAASVTSFSELLQKAVIEVDSRQKEAQQAVEEFTLGKKDVHQVVLALHQADISLKMAVEVRNKAVEAYQEIMRMTV